MSTTTTTTTQETDIDDTTTTTASNGDDSSDETTPASTEPPATTTPPGVEVPAGLAGLVAVAVNDLAERFDIDASAISVVEVREVIWRDSSLGCPVEGMSYLQVLVDGSLIVLEANGQTYQYHSGRDGVPFYCANPQTPAEDGGGLSDS